MTRRAKTNSRSVAHEQTGATLLVAIMMLLIITLLALASMRGVSLESRITGNLKQLKTLNNAAEAGLRMGEDSVRDYKCLSATFKPCVSVLNIPVNSDVDYTQLFANSNIAGANVNSVSTGYDVKIQWYVVALRQLGGQTRNDCGLRNSPNCGPYYFEITSCASTVLCTSDTTTQRVILRSVVNF